MKRFLIVVIFLYSAHSAFTQTVSTRLQNAIKNLQADAQMRHALIGFEVKESNSGKIVYRVNEEVGFAGASTQKIITAATAYEVLGKEYRYNTTVGYTGNISNKILYGDLIITGSGDPTMGSWRYASSRPGVILNIIKVALKQNNIDSIAGNLLFDEKYFSYRSVPGGWPFDDIGNYYGAGAGAINWNENQYDILLETGRKEGDSVRIVSTKPAVNYEYKNQLSTGKAGSGDNAYIFMAPKSREALLEGTVPPQEKSFSISGSLSNPAEQLYNELSRVLPMQQASFKGFKKLPEEKDIIPIVNLYSPTLDSIIYFFLKKSINLYGEALVKTIAKDQGELGSTENGLSLLKKFWQKNNVDSTAIKMIDGSGLSPANRITPAALVDVLLFAKSKKWFSGFYDALPLYNGMKMKSGTIGGVKGFAGYHTSAAGVDYTFAIVINNYDGSTNAIVQKMYNVLNELK